jgi:L-asparaginase II
MLALARFLGEPIEDYISPNHPVQRRILAAFAEMCDLTQEDVAIGIDGCSVPTFAVPLRAAAVAYARLADPRDLPETRARACRRIFEAMRAHPDMVAGPGKLDTRLMAEAHGRLVAKGGAEGYHGVALAPGALGGGSPGLGIAAKIADGDAAQRAGGRVILAVLHALGVLGAEDLERLADFSHARVTNWRNLLVGEMHACPPLERAP